MTRRQIVLGLDGSAGAAAALDWCLEYAPLLDAEIIAVHVLDFGPQYFVPATVAALQPPIGEVRAAHREMLEKWVQVLRDAGVEHRTKLATGQPAEALEKIATEQNAELIVVGRRGHGGFAELLLGSVPHALAHHAHKPVVIVPVVP